jgi:preprotein translocase subunit YajC
MNNIKVFLFMERAWLTIALIGLAGMVYFLVVNDKDTVLMMGILTIAGFAMFWLRRRQRKNEEKRN